MIRPCRLRLALFQPDIPQNAGTMLRSCACLGIGADLIEPAGFPTSDRHFRRAGLDYLAFVDLRRHASFAAFEAARRSVAAPEGIGRLLLLTTKADRDYLDFAYRPGDIVMVGRESAGVPDEVHAAADARLGISLLPGRRSLNVAVAAAMALGEALRQLRAEPARSGQSPSESAG
jgi:tRNA (cytidine/uridine-2'-O-)-methyltransferase